MISKLLNVRLSRIYKIFLNQIEKLLTLKLFIFKKGPRGVPGTPGPPGMDGIDGMKGNTGYS